MCAVSILFAGLLQSVAAPPAPGPETEVAAEAPAAWWAPFGLSVSLETEVGIGSFVADANADNPYWGSTLTLSPSWKLTDQLRLQSTFWMTYEWTYLITSCSPSEGPRAAGAPALDCSDTEDGNANRFNSSDLQLELDVSELELWTMDLGGQVAVAFPTSRFSLAASNLLTVSMSTNASRTFGFFTPSLSFGFAKFFSSENAPTLDTDEAGDATPIARCPAGFPVNCIALSGFAPNWRIRTGLGAHFDVPALAGLSFDIELGYIYTRSFGRDPDQFSSAAVDASGSRVVDGTSENDTTFGLISATYAPTDHWSFSLGVSSAQPVMTADGKSVRFPFYDFVSPANNFTSWYLSVGYQL